MIRDRALRLSPRTRRLLKRLPGASWVRDRLYQRPRGPAPAPGSLRPVVYLPTWLEWDVMRQRPQYLLEALARSGHPVYFVDPRIKGGDVERGAVTLTASLASCPREGVILYTHFAPNRTLIDGFDHPAVVYDILDDLSIYAPDEIDVPARRKVRHHHPFLMACADVVIASNEVLVARHRTERGDVVLVENGVDPQLFSSGGEKVDLGTDPVIGYHGAIAPWLDFGLIAAVVESRPDYRFVFLGPVEGGAAAAVDELDRFPNVAWLPRMPVERVAAHVRGFDAGWIPFVVSPMTQGVTPLKMFEFLACEKPVVATPLPACVRHPAVMVASTSSEMARALDDAIGMSPEGRRRLREHGVEAAWGRRIEPLLNRLEQLELRRVP